MTRFADGLERRAAGVVPPEVLRYVSQGSRDGVTAGEAEAAWDAFRFLPRVLRSVGEVDTSTTLLGTAVSAPVAVAPTTLQRAVHPDGEIAMAAGVAAAGSLLVVSSNAGSAFEAIAAAGAPWWLQLYVPSDRELGAPLVARAAAAGASALVLTVDTPVVGTKYDGEGPTVWDTAGPDWLRANLPGGPAGPGAEKAADLGPGDVERLARSSGLPVVVKGVLRADDALRCVEAGARAVWVSNHGGRQLDHTAATAHRLATVAAAVRAADSTVEVYVDGGVRSARHTATALALGARGVFLGRPPLHALAVGGAEGVRDLLEEHRDELAEHLLLLGCTAPDDVSADVLERAPWALGTV